MWSGAWGGGLRKMAFEIQAPFPGAVQWNSGAGNIACAHTTKTRHTFRKTPFLAPPMVVEVCALGVKGSTTHYQDFHHL
eukprot:3705493-Heterocapsa_arctica.AAC.1